MSARYITIAIILTLIQLGNSCLPDCKFSEEDYTEYVNPFIGTAGNGHTYPGATFPFGMVQVSPETGNIGWDYCSGYHYEDSTIMGFSHTHLSGTGWMDMGDILVQAFTGNINKDNFPSRFSHDRESASPGYYSVYLSDFEIKAEFTTTQRAAYHKYTFNTGVEKHLMIDLKHGIVPTEEALENHIVESDLVVENDQTVSGYTISQGWAGNKHIYFVIKLKEPITSTNWLSDSAARRNHRIVLNFGEKSAQVVEMKIAISAVSAEGAGENLKHEIKGWDFEAVRKTASDTWNNYLRKIEITDTKKVKEIFYTAMYHNLIVPNNIADVDGKFRGPDQQVYTAQNKSYYSTLSLWDTYRATNPLYTLLFPEVANDIVKTMLTHFEITGILPIWILWGHENFCMIGNHSIPLIADVFLRGTGNFDIDRAYEAVRISSIQNHFKSDWDKYNRYGYLPSDSVIEEAVSRTLEFAFDDWCVAQMAQKTGRIEDYEYFSRRAGFYKNLYDRHSGLMRGKNSDGSWVSPFDPYKISHAGTGGGDYTEANAWQYTWHVQHDINGLIDLMGGDDIFISMLDSLFNLEPVIYGDGKTVDVSGLIGQYVHGNEPCHHVAYLYTYAGKPWKTQEKVHEIIHTLYNNTPDGLCGNDDCGQMSAWYIFSTLGFYPVTLGGDYYVIGRPFFKNATIHLPDGHCFTIKGNNISEENYYIQSARLNGKKYNRSYIKINDILKGGRLEFIMGSIPQNEFGINPEDRPVSRIGNFEQE